MNRCTVPECIRPIHGKGLCKMHHTRKRRTGTTVKTGRRVAGDPPRHCAIPGCKCEARSRGWCNLHYKRWQNTGNPYGIKANPGRSKQLTNTNDHNPPLCFVPGCKLRSFIGGRCIPHHLALGPTQDAMLGT